ncbi:MAG: carbon storage regulator CsrA [Hydrogenoanaerobacterium sp.]
MLVLSRKAGESVYIGGDIKITVVELIGDKIKIGIEAPKSMTVLREELYQTLSTNKQATENVNSQLLRELAQSFKKAKLPNE